MGSVKDLHVVREPTEEEAGEGVFNFSDRYSAFDWGEMPDHIPHKGAALCMMAAWNFEQLESQGVGTHYLGLVDEEGNTVSVSDLVKQGIQSNNMLVKLVRVLSPDNDYLAYSTPANNFLIPIEIVFRNGLPEGSSVFKKLAQAKKNGLLPQALQVLGLPTEPVPGQMLPFPVYDYWTKLEATDRLLNDDEAKRISGLGERFSELRAIAEQVNSFVTGQAQKRGMVHFDGKIECIYSDNELLVADTVGTLDEDRFAFQGLQVSKQILRNAYLNTPWYADLEEAKKKAGKDDDLQALCPSKPDPLPPDFVALVSGIYQSACNQYTGEKMFDVAELSALVKQLSDYKKVF